MSESNPCTCGDAMRPGGYDPNCPIDGEVPEDHGPGCDGPLNCTCPPVPTTFEVVTAHLERVRELSSRATNYYVAMPPGPMKPRALFIAQAAVAMRRAAEARWAVAAYDEFGDESTARVLP